MQWKNSLSLKDRHHWCRKWCGRYWNIPKSIDNLHIFFRWFQHSTREFHYSKNIISFHDYYDYYNLCSYLSRGWKIAESMSLLSVYTLFIIESTTNIFTDILKILVAIEKLSQNIFDKNRNERKKLVHLHFLCQILNAWQK